MKPCGCIESLAIYPCGHEKSSWVYCGKAKAKNLLKRGPLAPCDSYEKMRAEPDLESTCGSTCLTMVFLCSTCGADKQIGWQCSRCRTLRNRDMLVWGGCVCPKHWCNNIALGKHNRTICDKCKVECLLPPSKSKSRPTKKLPELYWKCHKCARNLWTSADAMVCSGPLGCGHRRCGKCSPLFRCSCKCICTYNFIEGGSKLCQFCANGKHVIDGDPNDSSVPPGTAL